jgi:hypothetical protein
MLGLIGKQRLGDHVRVQQHRVGLLPLACVECENTARERRTTPGCHAQLICRVVCQVGVFVRVRVAGGWGGRESGAPGSVSALPV